MRRLCHIQLPVTVLLARKVWAPGLGLRAPGGGHCSGGEGLMRLCVCVQRGAGRGGFPSLDLPAHARPKAAWGADVQLVAWVRVPARCLAKP